MKSGVYLATAALTLGAASTVSADVTTNVGWASDYIFRGILQDDSSAFAGIDYTSGGFYAGTWAADVTQGAEVDLYLGYSGAAGDFGYTVGATGYFYTDDFDDTYKEINLGLTYGIASFDVAVGEYDNFSGPTQDYTFYSLTLSKGGFYGLVGSFGEDFNGEYVEAGYGFNVSGLDLGFSVVHSTEDLVGDDDTSLILTISKTFDLGGSDTP